MPTTLAAQLTRTIVHEALRQNRQHQLPTKVETQPSTKLRDINVHEGPRLHSRRPDRCLTTPGVQDRHGDLNNSKIGTIRGYLAAVGGSLAIEYDTDDARIQVA